MKAVETFNPRRTGYGATTMWDRFRLHHVFTDHSLMVHFETGETCVTTRFFGRMGESDYRLYKDRNIILASTTSGNFTTLLQKHKIALLDPETNKPVPASWLQKAATDATDQQLLVIDLDHMIAVGMGPAYTYSRRVTDPRRDWFHRKPRHVQQALGVYYPSPGVAPEGYSVRLTRPYRMSNDEKAHKESLTRAAKAWWTMSGWAEKSEHDVTVWRQLCAKSGVTAALAHSEMRTPVEWLNIKDKEFSDLNHVTRAKLVWNGATTNRVASYHTHLDVKATGNEQ